MALKLRTKLLAGFILVSLIGAGIGIYGVNTANSLSNELKSMYEGNTLAISALVHMKGNFIEMRLAVTKAGIAKDAAEVDYYYESFMKSVGASEDWSKKYEATISSAEGRRLFDEYAKTRETYNEAVMPIFAAMRAGDVATAQAIILDKSATGAANQGLIHQQAVDALVSYNEKLAASQAKSSMDASRTASVILISLTGGGFALSVFLGIWLGVFIISRPLIRLSGTLQSGSEQIAAASDQLAQSAQEIANGAAEQASSVEETSSSMEELSSMVKQNLANSREASLLAAKASGASQEGGVDVERMVSAMQGIVKSSEEVGKVIKLIEDISFQTNILALNAAVEAARAGEAGMGFAVVADEVKNLANRSAEAAKETAGMIEESIRRAEEGAKIAEGVASSFKDILQSTQKVAEMSREVETASVQQDTGISQVTKAIVQFDQVVQANASTAEEAASSADELSSQAASLMRLVDDLTRLVRGKVERHEATVHRHGGLVDGRLERRAQAPRSIAPKASAPRPAAPRSELAHKEISPEKLIPFEDDEEFKEV
jgi:methyl-accepting chemotaxis protein